MKFIFPEEFNRSHYRLMSHAWQDEILPGASAGVLPEAVQPGAVIDLRVRVAFVHGLPVGTHMLLYLPFIRERGPGDYDPRVAVAGVVPEGYAVNGANLFFEFILTMPVVEPACLEFVFPRVRLQSRPAEFKGDVYVRLPGDDFRCVRPSPHLVIKDADAEGLVVHASNNLRDSMLRFTVVARQPRENAFLPAPGYTGRVEVECGDYRTVHVFTPEERGLYRGAVPVKPRAREAVRVTACDQERGWSAASELVVPSFRPDGFQVFFGDLHVHSNRSDGYGEQEEIMAHARDWKQLDFIALNEHIENELTPRPWTGGKWRAVRECFDAFYCPGAFVTIGGFEFRSYCNLWCFDDEYAQYHDSPFNDYGSMEQEEIHASIARMARKPNWLAGYHRLEVMRESGEPLPPPVHLLQVAHYKRPPEIGSELFLERGDRAGFFGATDTHDGLPGQALVGRELHAQSGLTAVIARELTRESLHEALRARRCYATMGSRHLVNLTVNGHWMGESFALDPGMLVEICCEVWGGEAIERIEIVRNGATAAVFDFGDGSGHAQLEWRDTSEPAAGTVYYFARIRLQDRRMIWTSPVWVQVDEGQS